MKKVISITSLIFFVLAFCLGIGVFFTALNKNILLADKLLSYVWVLLLVGAILKLVMLTSSKVWSLWEAFDQFGVVLYERFGNRILPVLSQKKILIPTILLISLLNGFSSVYSLGGDDTRLYYLYPKAFFDFTLRVGPETAVSSLATFLPPSCLVLFAGLLVVLKAIIGNLNMQSMLYTLNLLLGIWGFYSLTKYLSGNKTTFSPMLRFLSGVMYVFSIFTFYTLLNSQLVAIFLISTYPISMYWYVKGIQENKKYYLVATALLWTVFCYFSVVLPWFAGIFLVTLPLLLYYFRNSFLVFLKANIFFGVMLLLFNLFWIAALPYTYAVGGSNKTVSSISSQSFRSQNEQGIRSVSEKNTVFYPLLNTYHADIQRNYKWPYLPIFEKWYKRLLLINAVWLGIILFSLLKYRKSDQKTILPGLLASFILGIYLFTANIGNWGLPFFIWLSNTIPGFVIFRNMYDKFAFAVAFVFAFLVFLSIEMLFRTLVSNKVKRLLVCCIAFVILLNAVPYLLGKFQNLPIWTTQHSYSKVHAINDDYLALTQFAKQQQSASRYVWFPLNYGNVSQIQDKDNSSYYYNGTSPFIFFAGKNDYSGILSFERYGTELVDDIRNRRYASVGKLFQQFNAKYIIVNHTVSQELQDSYLCGEGLCAMQDDAFTKALVGKKIKDFGKRYSLYEIASPFNSEKLFFTDTLQHISITKPVPYSHIAYNEYKIYVKKAKPGDTLVFLDPFSPRWNFFVDGKSRENVGMYVPTFGYAGAWRINKPLNNAMLSLKFDLGGLYYTFVAISVLSLAVGLLYLEIVIRKSLMKK